MLATGLLPDTKTRDRWAFAYAAAGDPAGLSAGELAITEFTGVRVKRAITDTYDIEPVPCLGKPGRAFLLCRLKRSGDLDTVRGKEALSRCGNVYECALWADGSHHCTCPAGQTEKARERTVGTAPCLHVLALRELLLTASIPEPADDPHPLDHAAMCSQDAAWWLDQEGAGVVPGYRDDDAEGW